MPNRRRKCLQAQRQASAKSNIAHEHPSAIVMAGELIDYLILMPFFDKAQIDALMMQPLSKAWIAVPGNILLSVVVVIAYIKRVIRGKKSDGEAG